MPEVLISKGQTTSVDLFNFFFFSHPNQCLITGISKVNACVIPLMVKCI